MPANTPTLKGVTTLSWGTEGKVSTPSGMIVEKIDIRNKYDDPIAEIENGDGAGVALALLDDGFNATVTGKYDTSATYPTMGTTAVTLTFKNGLTYACHVVSVPRPSFVQKKEATIQIKLAYRPGITAS